jgi:hypothetical protein
VSYREVFKRGSYKLIYSVDLLVVLESRLNNHYFGKLVSRYLEGKVKNQPS